MKIAWITSIFGGIDAPKEIPEQTVHFTHYHFDESCNAKSLKNLNDRTKALYFKTQHHNVIDADYYIYTDGKIQVLANDFIEQMIDQLGDNYFGMAPHPAGRKCVYEEVGYILEEIENGSQYLKVRYGGRPILFQVEKYRNMCYPEHNGLHDAAIFIHRNKAMINSIFDEWWMACYCGDYDQIAIQYLCWNHGVKIKTLNFKPQSFKQVNHLKLQ